VKFWTPLQSAPIESATRLVTADLTPDTARGDRGGSHGAGLLAASQVEHARLVRRPDNERGPGP